MSEKHLVCHGAICQCKYGTTPDKISVKSQTRHYINDSGTQKLMANTKDIGQPFELNTFGSCKKMNNNPCQPAITEWKDFYEAVTLINKGHPLLEDSKGTCAVGGPQSIDIKFHGQVAQPGPKNVAKADKDVQSQLNPLVEVGEADSARNQKYYLKKL